MNLFPFLSDQPIQWVKQGVFRNARIIDPSQSIDKTGHIEIKNGSLHKLVLDEDWTPDATIAWDVNLDLNNKIICPSFIEIGCFIPEPGYEQKGTLETEFAAAAKAGYSHISSLPITSPIADSPEVISALLERAQAYPGLHLLPMGALTQKLESKHISELYALKLAGCVGVTNARNEIPNQKILLHCLEYAATHDLLVCFYSESKDLAMEGCAHQGASAARLGLPGVPTCAETVAIARDLLLVEHAGVSAHFSQVSSARSVELIADAQARGVNVTADVGMPNLIYTDHNVSGFNPQFHLKPPLRTEEDRIGLIEGLKSGVISAISSGHTPHERSAKAAPFAETSAGMSTFDTQMYWINHLVNKGELSWLDCIKGLTGGAKVFDLDAGHLKLGSAASFTIIDPSIEWVCDEGSMVSQGKNNPLLGQRLKGRVMLQVRGVSLS